MREKNRKLRVLLVEDRVGTVAQLAQVVKSGVSDLRVAITASKEAAIGQLQSQTPDLMILDLNLRDGSGLNVLHAAKELRRSPVIIVLMNGSPPEIRNRALQMGADYFLERVGNSATLSAIVRSVAQQQEARAAAGAEVILAENEPVAGTLSDEEERGHSDPNESAKRLH